MQVCIFSDHKYSLGSSRLPFSYYKSNHNNVMRYRIILKCYSHNYFTWNHYSELSGVFPSRFCFSWWNFFLHYQDTTHILSIFYACISISSCYCNFQWQPNITLYRSPQIYLTIFLIVASKFFAMINKICNDLLGDHLIRHINV